MDNNHFGERLRAWREYRRFSVQELATASGLLYNDVYRVEGGQHKTINVDKALKLARALGITVEQLAEGLPGGSEK